LALIILIDAGAISRHLRVRVELGPKLRSQIRRKLRGVLLAVELALTSCHHLVGWVLALSGGEHRLLLDGREDHIAAIRLHGAVLEAKGSLEASEVCTTDEAAGGILILLPRPT
jgi:hypothetical protein